MADRALGAFIGLAIGDALGTTLEFSARDSYEPLTEMEGGGPFRLAPGEWTDDTAMAIGLAASLIAKRGEIDEVDLAQRWLAWWRKGENSVTGVCFDIGSTTASALANFETTGKPEGRKDAMSAGNGGIMRLAPAALAAGGDAERAARLARRQSAVTHGSAECVEAAELLARILSAAIVGDGRGALTPAEARYETPKIGALAKGLWRGRSRGAIRSSGYVVDTLEAALWAVDSSFSFSEAVLKAVNLGNDADTIGAVTGQIAGAIFGYGAIPAAWRARLAWHDVLADLAHALWAIGAASGKSPPQN
jgi:ADP-ribosyl-[dinitrogen reductase] hydrolase